MQGWESSWGEWTFETVEWWKRLLTRWDNLSLGTKKVIVRVGTGAGILACLHYSAFWRDVIRSPV
jgi:hypothetical protein